MFNINWKEIISSKIIRTLTATVFGLLLSWIIISIFTKSPSSFIYAIIDGSFLNQRKVGSYLTTVVILIAVGISLSICYKANFINLSVPGQMLLSSTLSYIIAFKMQSNHSAAFIVAFLVSFLSTAFVSIFIILMNYMFKVNVVILAIMINWIIFYFYKMMLGTASGHEWVNPAGGIPTNMNLNFQGFMGNKLSIFFPIIIILAILVWGFFKWTPWGFQMIVSGKSIKVAETLGIKSTRNLIWIAIISSLFSTIAGYVYVFSKQQGVLSSQLPASPPEGWIGLVVALMAFSNPIATIPISFLFAMIMQSQTTIQLHAEVNNNVVELANGVLMISVTSLPFALTIIPWKNIWNYNWFNIRKLRKGGK